MVAGSLANAGYFQGESLYPPRDANPKGFFEGPRINGINEALLAPIVGVEEGLSDGQRWLAALPTGTPLPSPPGLDPQIREAVAQQPFCFKDPRFCYTLPAWRPHLPQDTAFVCVFRHPAASARSIVKECRDASYLSSVEMTRDRALSIWTRMYEWVLKVHRRRGDWLFLQYDQVLEGDGIQRLEDLLGVQPDRSFPEVGLRRSPATDPVPEPVRRVYDQLCALSRESSAACPSNGNLVPVQ